MCVCVSVCEREREGERERGREGEGKRVSFLCPVCVFVIVLLSAHWPSG